MAFTFGLAETSEEKEAVYRFRYSVYVEEMGRYQDTADHANRRLVEPEDDHSWIFFANDGVDVVATARLTWGGDGFSERQIHQYSLQPFLDELPPNLMAVGERAMVEPQHRGSGLLDDLMEHSRALVEDYDIRIVFGACEPHLLSLYLGMGQRTYADKNINSAEAGYLIPLVSLPKGADSLVGLGDASDDPLAVPSCVRRVLSSEGGAVLSPMLMEPSQYWGEVNEALQELEHRGIGAFDGFSEDEVERCLSRSNIIECDTGDHVLKKGGVARNIFVVLDGTLEVRDGDRVVGVLSRGEVFGEIAFLLERPRGLDVYAATDGARVLSLSEGTLRKMIADDAVVAAKLLFNVSKMLCLRLIKAN
jgi:hypothetical protein